MKYSRSSSSHPSALDGGENAGSNYAASRQQQYRQAIQYAYD